MKTMTDFIFLGSKITADGDCSHEIIRHSPWKKGYDKSAAAAAAAAKSLQSCPTQFDHIDGSPPGSPVPGILQARILEWVEHIKKQRHHFVHKSPYIHSYGFSSSRVQM